MLGDLATSKASVRIELRRLTIINRTVRSRLIEITSYMELALAPQAADATHPAFSKMFVETMREDDPEGYQAEALGLFRGGLSAEDAKTNGLGNLAMRTVPRGSKSATRSCVSRFSAISSLREAPG